MELDTTGSVSVTAAPSGSAVQTNSLSGQPASAEAASHMPSLSNTSRSAIGRHRARALFLLSRGVTPMRPAARVSRAVCSRMAFEPAERVRADGGAS